MVCSSLRSHSLTGATRDGARVFHGAVARPPILDVPVRETPIRLGQFLKLAGFAEHGAHAKELLEDGEVQVNGRVETRRGAQLTLGDVVALDGRRARVVAGLTPSR
jgi:ribosome-associated protein